MCSDEVIPYYEALPSALVPYNYAIAIDEIDVSGSTFHGEVIINIKVARPTDELHLNYRDLSIDKANVSIFTATGESVTVVDLVENKHKEYFVIKFDRIISNGELLVKIGYDGIIQTNMAGFYKSSYVQDNEEKFMISTQFEATDARRAFPCFDEPSYKATFNVTLTLRDDWTALSNTPVLSETPSGNGLKTVTFEPSPIMSSYLLAWACGDFEYIESFTNDTYNGKKIPVRVYTTPGYIKEAEFACEIAPKIVDYFSKIFEVQYPLAKLDLLAVHSFSHNAMENWGLITYRSTALLYSPTKSSAAYKKKVAYVVAHELAHQWFGNLVTMKWWDELWLNEGFATWVGWVAVDYLFPEWDIFSEFVSETIQPALNLDGLRNSHPIEVPVVDALDIDQVFDAISYLKGASTIVMLSTYLGRDVFLKGVAKYLNLNKYNNASSHDLWNAIGEVSGKPIDTLMGNWINKIGFPILNVDLKDGALQIQQSRFLNGGDVSAADNETKWWVPLNVAASENVSLPCTELDGECTTIKDFPLVDDFFKLNREGSGFYRVNYSGEIMEKNILPYFNKVSAKDKVGLYADSAAIAIAGNSSTTAFLNLVMSTCKELGDDYVVWLELGKRLSHFASTFSGEDEKLTQLVTNFLVSVYGPKSIEIVNELKSGNVDKNDFVKTSLRANILSAAGLLPIPEVQSYALELFEKWAQGEAIDPTLRHFVYSSVIGSPNLTQAQFDKVYNEISSSNSLDGREIALGALGHISDSSFLKKLLDGLLYNEIIPTMDSHFLAIPLSRNSKMRDSFWKFFKEKYEQLYKLMSANMVVLDRFVKVTLCNYQSEQMFDEVADFFADKDVHGFERAFNQSLDNIKINSNWYKRDSSAVKEFLTANGY
jgi:aminopeptidase N